MPTTVGERRALPVGEKLVPVTVHNLGPCVLDFDLYVKRSASEDPIPYCRQGYSLGNADIARLIKRGFHTVYVQQCAHSVYRNQVLDTLAKAKDIPAIELYRVQQEVNRSIFETTFKQGTVDEFVHLTTDMGSRLSEVVRHERLVFSDLFELMGHDNYTYTHSVNVCTYALLLAGNLGITDPSDRRRIAKGALLHDIGKREVRLTVLNKRGPLNSRERKHIQRHSVLGFASLFLREDMLWGELMMVYQHHERIDGGGYPVATPGSEIHPWARICAIADIFQAITSDRPYRPAGSVEEANSYLKKEAGFSLDKEMVQCWTKTMKLPGGG